MFTPFQKPPYTYPYGRSIDETMTSTQRRPLPLAFGMTTGLAIHVG
jgi:hypothetical protein